MYSSSATEVYFFYFHVKLCLHISWVMNCIVININCCGKIVTTNLIVETLKPSKSRNEN